MYVSGQTQSHRKEKHRACPPCWRGEVAMKWIGSILVFLVLASSIAASKFCVIALCRMVSAHTH
jgi:RNA polymerase subunit RPABC4/transcription elongation factor Spt4